MHNSRLFAIDRPPDKSAYLKVIVLISQSKHISCVPKTNVKTDGLEKNNNYRLSGHVH